jgi:hypothetical protein
MINNGQGTAVLLYIRATSPLHELYTFYFGL